MPAILPPAEEWEQLAPGPGTVCFERAGDARLALAAGYALLLQVSHPTVGAGVSEHSQFREDPWRRLWRTLDYSYTMVHGGPRAAGEMGRLIRSSHRRIRGVRPDGTRYHALEPEAYAWVHATLAESIVSGHERFGRPFSHPERERFWTEWRDAGRLLGVRPRDLPAGWEGFRAYFDEMVSGRLQHTLAVDEVLQALGRPAPPQLDALGMVGWSAARVPLAHVVRLATVGLLPPVLRRRFGIGLTLAQQLELKAIARALRSATPVMPPWLRNTGPGYLRWRRDAPDRL
jgi:uncharacterized protein (DUF2236 family)